ncbi:serine protease [Oenococcus oeni IOEB_C23]|uniref:rhomboid family intramembrane serine protease n=1 Tax=Oenococcus oeni TaxID=1247 RepID=UPI00050F6BD7|nr:rhomboid family intramembrane serine protease [Oenococcus oeni]KGH67072.1 serine protease [Oenococcus oeni IOEB_C23]SYW08212.1 putative rhomboid protease [Oenococcus oeni]SYW20215.1 putative rhomboid protease [Oenococcus oeni]
MRKSFLRFIPPVTLSIFSITVFIYFFQVFFDAYLFHSFGLFSLINRFINGPSIQSLILLGGQVSSLILKGQWYRLFTPIFLHSSLMHIFSNMFTLIIFGPFVEKLFGKTKYLLIYLLSGLWGNLLTLIFDPNPNIVSVGASGALFGLFGAMISIAWFNRNNPIFKRQLVVFAALALFNLISNIGDQSVDIWAHIGGLISGILTSLVCNFPSAQYGKVKTIIRVIAFCIFLLPFGFLLLKIQ